jgi:hypothetical protein
LQQNFDSIDDLICRAVAIFGNSASSEKTIGGKPVVEEIPPGREQGRQSMSGDVI